MMTKQEIELFSRAIELAEKNGLAVEFVESFDEFVKSGDSIPEAIRCALYEWDIG